MNEFPFSGSDPEIKQNPKSTTFALGPGRSRIVGEGEMSVLIRNARWELTSLGADRWLAPGSHLGGEFNAREPVSRFHLLGSGDASLL